MGAAVHHDVALPALALTNVVEHRDSAGRLHDPPEADAVADRPDDLQPPPIRQRTANDARPPDCRRSDLWSPCCTAEAVPRIAARASHRPLAPAARQLLVLAGLGRLQRDNEIRVRRSRRQPEEPQASPAAAKAYRRIDVAAMRAPVALTAGRERLRGISRSDVSQCAPASFLSRRRCRSNQRSTLLSGDLRQQARERTAAYQFVGPDACRSGSPGVLYRRGVPTRGGSRRRLSRCRCDGHRNGGAFAAAAAVIIKPENQSRI